MYNYAIVFIIHLGIVGPRRKVPALYTGAGPLVNVEQTGSLTLLWGATGEQEWTPALTTGRRFELFLVVL